MVDPAPVDLTATLADALTARGWMLAAAESCTGGWIAKTCTDRPGSSAWFERGFVTYSNAAKTDMLDVAPALLETHGAVSEAVALAMAAGALQRSQADVSVAVTGIAGPDGGTVEKPVGTVCFAWSGRGLGTRCETRCFAGDRDSIRLQSVRVALQGLLELLRP